MPESARSPAPPAPAPPAPAPPAHAPPHAPARGRRRDRRGRGLRGPDVLAPEILAPAILAPDVLARDAVTTGRGRLRRTRRERFDALALDVVAEVDERWQGHLGLVEYAVEDTPVLPEDWQGESVPLSSLVRGSGSRPSRLVLFRRPIEHRCSGRDELEAFLRSLVVEQVARLLDLDPEDVDPRYRR